MAGKITGKVSIVLDFYDKSIRKLNKMDNVERCRVLEFAGLTLRGKKTTLYNRMMQGKVWHPKLDVDRASGHPVVASIHRAIAAAAADYNSRGFPRTFQSTPEYYEEVWNESEEDESQVAESVRREGGSRGGDNSCTTYVWIDGVLVPVFSYCVEPDGDVPESDAAVIMPGSPSKRTYKNIYEDSDEWPDLEAKWMMHLQFEMELPFRHIRRRRDRKDHRRPGTQELGLG